MIIINCVINCFFFSFIVPSLNNPLPIVAVFSRILLKMYDNLGAQSGVPGPSIAQPNPFGNAFYGASSGFIKNGLGAYGEKILGSSSEYVQSNVSIPEPCD